MTHLNADPVRREEVSQPFAGIPARQILSRPASARGFAQFEAGRDILTGKCETPPANGMQGQKHVGLSSPATQATHTDIEADVVEVINVFAQRFDKCAPVDDPATFAEQEFQHPLFGGRQTKTMSQSVTQYPAAFDKRPFRCRPSRGDWLLMKSLTERKHRRGKLAWLEGLDKVSVGALLKSLDPVGCRPFRRRNYNSDRSSRPQMGGHRQPIFSVEVNVDNNDVRGFNRVGPVKRRSVAKSIYVQAQPG